MNTRLVGAALVAGSALSSISYAIALMAPLLYVPKVDLLLHVLRWVIAAVNALILVGALIGRASVPTALGAAFLVVSGLMPEAMILISLLLPPSFWPYIPMITTAAFTVFPLAGLTLVALGLILWYRMPVPTLLGLLTVAGGVLIAISNFSILTATADLLPDIRQISTAGFAASVAGSAGLGVYALLASHKTAP